MTKREKAHGGRTGSSAKAGRGRGYLTPNEVARMLMVSPVTVRQWASRGLLKAETTLGGHRRFLQHDVARFARENDMTLNVADNDDVLRVLIVDDDPMMPIYLRELVGTLPGVTVESSSSGFDAGVKIHQFRPHVVLLDIMMVGMDGFAVCISIKADPQTRGIRVFAMTGYPSPDTTARILAAGAEVCLSKPIDAEQLLARLRDAMAR